MDKNKKKTFGSWSVKELLLMVAIWAAVVVLAMPVILLGFSQGKDGGMTIWNFVGLVVYPAVLWIIWEVTKFAIEKR